MNKYKIAVCTIARNEMVNIDKFLQSCQGADEVVIGVDVRSTDDTEKRLREWGVKVVPLDIQPWHFAEARNLVLDNVSDDVDICVSIDLDERLSKDWRKVVEEEWESDLDLMNYVYIYHWLDKEMTQPGLVIHGYKIYNRHSFRWQNAIHENLKYIGEKTEEKKKYTDKITVFHYPDYDKPREYLEIIERALVEDPENTWMIYVLSRECFTSKKYERCIEVCKKYLYETESYKTVELGECRAECCRMIARCLHMLNIGEIGEKQVWMLRAVSEAPNQRENWIWLAEAWLMYGNELSALAAFHNGLSITDRSRSPECEERCWNDMYVRHEIDKLKMKLNLKNKKI
jgi:hypothetical protein